MLKTLPIIPSSTFQKNYPLFLFYSPNIPILFFLFYCFVYLHLEKHGLDA